MRVFLREEAKRHVFTDSTANVSLSRKRGSARHPVCIGSNTFEPVAMDCSALVRCCSV